MNSTQQLLNSVPSVIQGPLIPISGQYPVTPRSSIPFPPFQHGPVIPVEPVQRVRPVPVFDRYNKWPYNNHGRYTNYKILRFRDMLYPDTFPINEPSFSHV